MYKQNMKLSHLILGVSVAAISVSTALATHNSPEELEARVSAIGQMNISETASSAASADSGPADGASVYGTSCAACHDAGVGGAPVVGEEADWTDRIAQGMDVLLDHAINGYQGEAGVMPAKGGNPSLSDEEVTAAVEHMVARVGGMPDGAEETAEPATEEDATESAEAMDEAAGESEETTQVAAVSSVDGKAVYDKACFACHTAGVAGAPKLGDPAAWADRIARGMDSMANNAINGYQGDAGVMPAKGGNPSLSDEEVTAAVQYMVEQSQ